MKTAFVLLAGAVAFATLATANSGGYRYGVSDQAFYIPSVIKSLNPSLYPRDSLLIEAQSGLMLSDNVIAALARRLGGDLPPLYLTLYGVTMVALFSAAIAFGRASGFSWWTIAAFVILLTFRHRIAKTGANTLEGYMHPRILAFAIGLVAFACVLRGRIAFAFLWTAVSAIAHPTTAFWFVIAVAVSAAIARPARRRWVLAGAAIGLAIGGWALISGPFAGRLITMDPPWLAALATKDYLFPTEWPLYAWLLNLAYVPLLWFTYRVRRSAGLAASGEGALIGGLLALAVLFAISVPLTARHLAIAVQMQVTRVFWVMDVVAVGYLAWWLTDGGRRSSVRLGAAIVAGLATLSLARGVYIVSVENNDRALVRMRPANSPWMEAMTWLKTQPSTWHVLADPMHSFVYGIAVRLAAERDTVLDASKDTALAMYDRDVALRVANRLAALGAYTHLTTADMRSLDARYALDVVVVENTQPLDLPLLHRNTQFSIYDLR